MGFGMKFGIRPVNIRIKSGGLEHTTFEAFQHSFDIDDVWEVCDGRLERWLEQKGKKDEAEHIKKISDSKSKLSAENNGKDVSASIGNNDLKLLQIFFPEVRKANNLFECFEQWNNDTSWQKNADLLFGYIQKHNIFDRKFALELYDENNEKYSYYVYNALRKALEQGEQLNAQEDFILGKLIYKTDPSFGLKFIEAARDEGCQEARAFLKRPIPEGVAVKLREHRDTKPLRTWYYSKYGGREERKLELKYQDYNKFINHLDWTFTDRDRWTIEQDVAAIAKLRTGIDDKYTRDLFKEFLSLVFRSCIYKKYFIELDAKFNEGICISQKFILMLLRKKWNCKIAIDAPFVIKDMFDVGEIQYLRKTLWNVDLYIPAGYIVGNLQPDTLSNREISFAFGIPSAFNIDMEKGLLTDSSIRDKIFFILEHLYEFELPWQEYWKN